MNKIVAQMLLLCLFIAFFASCSTKNYEVTYLTDTNIDAEINDITLITSYEELTEYMNSSRFSEAEKIVINKMESYQPAFFNKRMLVVINIEESTGSNEITVDNIDFDNSKAVITLKRRVSDISDDSIRIWSIFVEFDIQEIDSANYIFQ